MGTAPALAAGPFTIAALSRLAFNTARPLPSQLAMLRAALAELGFVEVSPGWWRSPRPGESPAPCEQSRPRLSCAAPSPADPVATAS
jgi:hypothetical protein